jgi:hypothetical protein
LSWSEPVLVTCPHIGWCLTPGAMLCRLAGTTLPLTQVMVATGITHPVVISLLGGLGAQGRLPAIRLFMPGTPSGGNATYAASSPLSDSTTGAGAGITRSSSSLTEQGLTLERLSSLGGWAPMAGHSSLLSTLSRALPFTPAAKGQEVWKTVQVGKCKQ